MVHSIILRSAHSLLHLPPRENASSQISNALIKEAVTELNHYRQYLYPYNVFVLICESKENEPCNSAFE